MTTEGIFVTQHEDEEFIIGPAFVFFRCILASGHFPSRVNIGRRSVEHIVLIPFFISIHRASWQLPHYI